MSLKIIPRFCVLLFHVWAGCLTILTSLSSVQCIQNKQLYFADRLYDSMKVGKTVRSFYSFFFLATVSSFDSLGTFNHMMCE